VDLHLHRVHFLVIITLRKDNFIALHIVYFLITLRHCVDDPRFTHVSV